MFSGIVEALGTVDAIHMEPPGCRLIVREPKIAADTQVADSICVNGCCLTVVEREAIPLDFKPDRKRLRTNLGELQPGGRVNLERALAVGGRLGGHFVSGHIDGVGTLHERQDHGEWSTYLVFLAAKTFAAQMASKGSIAVDGVSLTIVDSEPDRFSVALIPFTLSVTTLGLLSVGGKVNLETDILAKYVQRLAESQKWK